MTEAKIMTNDAEAALCKSLHITRRALHTIATALSHGGRVQPVRPSLNHRGLIDTHGIVTPEGRHIVAEARKAGW